MDEIIGADPAPDPAGSAAGGVTRRRLIYAAPALAAVGLVALFASRLGVDPSQVPSNLIGKRVPVFNLPPVQGRTLGLSSDDLHAEVSLVNMFASWCVACREEHPLLLRLKNVGSVPIHGLNYKDHPDDAARWLNTMGDPYTRSRKRPKQHWLLSADCQLRPNALLISVTRHSGVDSRATVFDHRIEPNVRSRNL